MSTTRRELFSMLPTALIPVFLRPAVSVAQETPLPSARYPFDKLPVRTTNNMQIRAVLKGKLATGESLEVHETTLAPGGVPHPPHRHAHSEMWLIREGTVELFVSGAKYVLGPGSVGFVHSNDEHGISNVAHRRHLILLWLSGPARPAKNLESAPPLSPCEVRHHPEHGGWVLGWA